MASQPEVLGHFVGKLKDWMEASKFAKTFSFSLLMPIGDS